MPRNPQPRSRDQATRVQIPFDARHRRRRPAARVAMEAPLELAPLGLRNTVSRGRGSGFCVHGRQRSVCVECGGKSICIHKKRRSRCSECGGGSLCQHGRRHGRCKEPECVGWSSSRGPSSQKLVQRLLAAAWAVPGASPGTFNPSLPMAHAVSFSGMYCPAMPPTVASEPAQVRVPRPRPRPILLRA